MNRRSLGLILPALGIMLILAPGVLAHPPAQGPPPEEIVVTAADEGRDVELTEGQTLVVRLQANPSTGYGWQVVEPEGGEILRQTQEGEFQPDSNLLGAPATQILRFEPLHDGDTTLKLEYRRPWDPAAEPAQEFRLQVRAAGAFAAVGPSSTQRSADEAPTSADEVASEDLPPAFNWCDLGGCTPVRDQGQCGSCWAFATVGPLELNIIIQAGETQDLSEQYLVSCNSERWGCDGGRGRMTITPVRFPLEETGQGPCGRRPFPTGPEMIPVSLLTPICTRSSRGTMLEGNQASLP